MTTCLAAVIHIRLTKISYTETSSIFDALVHVLSGFLYGILALNTKLTNLALLPFLLARSTLQHIKKMSSLKQPSVMGMCYRLSILFICFFTGAVGGYAPWMLLYYNETGRWLPNAWPSQKMIEKSVYMQEALNKPFHYYVTMITKISPVHVFGCMLLLMSALSSAWGTICGLIKDRSRIDKILFVDIEMISSLEYWILFLWPLGFLSGHTFVGMKGGGYQTRFLLPALPATSIITAIGVEKFRDVSSVLYIFVAIGCMHIMFYGIMFYPLFADFEFCVFDIIATILSSPQYAMDSRETYVQAFKYMKHFGLNRSVAGE